MKTRFAFGPLWVLVVAALVLTAAQPAGAAGQAGVSGKLVGFSAAGQNLTVQGGDGKQAILRVTSTSRLTRNGAPVGLAGLSLGDAVTGKVDRATLRVVSLSARGPAVTTTRGTFVSVDTAQRTLSVSTSAGAKNFLITPATQFIRNGHRAAPRDFAAGDAVVVHARPTAAGTPTATDCEADGPEQEDVEGAISTVSGNDVTITPLHGAAVTVHVTDSTVIRLHTSSGEVDGTLADLKTGMKTEAEYDPATLNAMRIEAVQPGSGGPGPKSHVAGKVSAVDAGAKTITITPEKGSPVTLGVDDSTRIQLDGSTAALGDIPTGAHAAAEYDPATNVASRIEAETEDEEGDTAEVAGTVSAVSPSSITIAPLNGGTAVTLTLNASTVIVVDGKRATAADIKTGAKAAAKYVRSTSVALGILVVTGGGGEGDLAEVSGQVTAVSSSSLTITPEHGGTAVTLTLDASTIIVIGDRRGTAADIKTGARAEARYNRATSVAVGVHVESEDGHGH